MRTLVLQWNWCLCEQIFCCVGKLKRRRERPIIREESATFLLHCFFARFVSFRSKSVLQISKKGWAFVIFTFWQMRTKFQSDFLSVSHLWILIVLQSLRLETFTTLTHFNQPQFVTWQVVQNCVKIYVISIFLSFFHIDKPRWTPRRTYANN